MKNVHLLAIMASVVVVGCSRDADPAPKAARSWTCANVAVPGGETLACTSSAITADGPAPMDGEPCEGSLDNPELCPPESGGGSGAGSAVWTDYDLAYLCRAGNPDCPPAGATPGTNTSDGTTADGTTGGTTDGTSDGTSNGGTTSGGTTSGGTTSGGTTDGTGGGDAKDGAKGGGEKGGGEKGGTTDGTSSTGTSGGGSGSGEQYECRGKGAKRECLKTPGGGGKTTDGTSGGSPTGGDGSGTASGGEGGLSGGSSSGTTTSNGKEATFDGSKDNGDGTSTWCWTVDEVSGQDLSNWVIGTGQCQIVSRSPSQGAESVNPDPNSGLVGMKWNTGDGFTTGQFCVTIKGTPTVGSIKFSMKAPGVAYGMTQGPVCK